MRTWSRGVLAAACAALLSSGAASADDVGGGSVAVPGSGSTVVEQLLDIMLASGQITQEQYEALKAQAQEEQEAAAVAMARAASETPKEPAGEGSKLKVMLDSKGFRVRSSDGAWGIKLGARLHADASGHFGSPADSEANNGTEVRRGRLNLQGNIFEDYLFQAEVDFADNDVAIKDFLVGYTGVPWAKLLVGHQKQPFSLAVEMSSNDIPFVERGTDTDLVLPFVDRAIGFRAQASGESWMVAGGIYGDGADKDEDGNEGWGSTLRAIWAPIRGENRVLHLGVRGAFREPDNDEVRIRSETTHLSSLYTVDTDTLTDIKRVFLVGPEAAFAYGPFALMGEYYHAFLDRRGGANLGFDGWHVEATWSLTGESRAASYRMDWGEFKGLRPARNFNPLKRHWGAWELATRYASIDLNDKDISGGRQGVVTVGLNWYLNTAIRLLFNWSRIVDAQSLTTDADGLNWLQGRVDFHF